MIDKEAITQVWRLYQKGKNHHSMRGIYSESERCHNFYSGRQWKGLESDGEELPVLNFIRPIGKYKISMIAQNLTSIVYSPLDDGNAVTKEICSKLTSFAAAEWERSKMDQLSWQVVKNAFVTGDHYCYCYDDRENKMFSREEMPRLKMCQVDKANVYFEDESNPNINEQKWVIISERMTVDRARALARKNGISEELVDGIVADEDEGGINSGFEDSCTSLLYMEKTDEGIEFCRSLKNAVYIEKRLISGLDIYPIVGYRWEEQAGDSRGNGGVKPLIANQLEVNKTAARRVVAVKRFAFPTLVYNIDKISNVDELAKIGSSIAVENMMENPVSSIVQYLNPAPISGDAQLLQSELISLSRELEGASDAATGMVDPTRASGEAIKASRDQAAISLNEQSALFKQFLEDVAVMWSKLFAVYMPQGIKLKNGKRVTRQELLAAAIAIRVDISPVDPYSRLAQETALERLLTSGYITFPEYVDALQASSSVPKGILQEILKKRELEKPQTTVDLPLDEKEKELLNYEM